MTTIELSLIPDTEADYQTVGNLMADFKGETGIDVHLKHMDWEDAWPQLIAIATQGQGVDVSHVGSTWVSSLMNMNALRPMPAHLVDKIGSEQAFVHSTWSSVILEADRNPYGIPLSAYVYIIAYRKDLLEKAGLNPVTAFATPAMLEESVRCLEALHAAENPWLMPIVPHPFNDFVHMAASWIWSSGGDIMDHRGKQVLLNSAAALTGLRSFFRLVRLVPDTDYLGSEECMSALLEGRAAAVVTDARALNAAIQNQAPNVENIGAASLMSIPWSGGGSLVIWRHTYGYPDRLAAAYKLVEFMVRKKTMMDLANHCYTLPSRTDALDELFPPDHALRPAMLQLIAAGRSYRPVALWHRIEYQFGAELGNVVERLMKDRNLDLDSILEDAMNSLVHRLNLTLG